VQQPTGLSESALKTKVEQYINKNMLESQGLTCQAAQVSVYNGYLKLVKLDIKEGNTVLQSGVDVYVSNDGETIFIGQVLNTSASLAQATPDTTQPPVQVETVDKPKAQAFIMSYCPYGLQFLKAYVPVMELLGNTADVQVNFVSYAMHGKPEIDANNDMYCIQKEQNAKFLPYLRCFVESGNSAACIASTGVDAIKVSSCVASVDAQYQTTANFNDQSKWLSGRYPLYLVQKTENDQFGVQGSPTFIVNGKQVSVSRSAESIKLAICSSFKVPPPECDTVLSTAAEAAGLGPIGSASPAGSASAQCG
jgi:protein-disulfide isomerase